jgi:N-acetylglucosaminyldiphosphoundecaprenol N-acetyl-beta-D-mannosaminyltransferase
MYAAGHTGFSSALPASATSGEPGPRAFAVGSAPAAQPIALLGVAFDNLTLGETVSCIEEMIASRRPHYVATANIDFLRLARRDAELQRLLLDAPLILCDGTPLVWASRLFGNALRERVAGADLVPELIRVAAIKHYRVFFLGTTEEANQQAIASLRAKFPDLAISYYSPPFQPLLEMDDTEIISRIRAAKPDLLFVAFGCPKAEKWLGMHYRELGVPVAIGVGATIDFLAGRLKRAPKWMQRSGLEWVHRLLGEPRRLFGRYAADLWFFGGAIAREWWTMKVRIQREPSASRTAIVQVESTWQRIEVADVLNRASIELDAACWREIWGAGSHCMLELAQTRYLDSTGMAVLLHVRKELNRSGRMLILLSPSEGVRRGLRAMGLEACFEVASGTQEGRALIEARARERSTNTAGELTGPLAWLGDVTVTSTEPIWERTGPALQRAHGAAESLIIDLAAVRFMDSGGVKLLMRVIEIARTLGVRLRFDDVSPPVRNVLRASNLEHLLERPG